MSSIRDSCGLFNPQLEAASQGDTLTDLQKVLADVSTHDCVCVLGDLNDQIGSNDQDYTDNWTGGPASKNVHKIMQLMRFNQLAAVNIMFKPKRRQTVYTFLQTESKGNAQSGQENDFGKYIDNKVKAK